MASKEDDTNNKAEESDLQTDIETNTALKKRLATFLKYNPHAEIGKKGKYFYAQRPWNDESVAFLLRPEAEFIKALNGLILPPRFTAIYHRDSKTMEYIYTVLESDEPRCKREFKFVLSGKSYFCKYGKASKELLTLSRQFRRTGKQSGSEHRNLLLLREYVQSQSKKRGTFEEAFLGMEPISFYVSGFKRFNEDEIVEVSKHLNFFMQYYDRESPFIVIHSPESESMDEFTQSRIPEIAFPETITTKRQDPFLLDLALTANTTTTARLQFIYYYQIIEYSAFYYIDAKTRTELLRIINNPDIQANVDSYIPRILEAINVGVRQEDYTKIESVVKSVCSLEAIWKEIERNMSYFTTKQEFDGGFVIEPLIPENCTKDFFCGSWNPKITITLSHIRNALVHGREKKFIHVITPTGRNDLLLRPWASIAQCIAEQVIIFGSPT
jgi:hypothetical protein